MTHPVPALAASRQCPMVVDCSAITGALVQTLRDLRALVSTLPAQQYTARTNNTFAGSTIGAHVRHCLDHIRALAEGRNAGSVDYDCRARGTAIEVEPAAAATEISRLIDAVLELSERDRDEPLEIVVLPSKAADGIQLSSTLGRELAFLLSHTIHHSATIRSMAVAIGCKTPESFGYAPSTLAHQDRCARLACAR